jgi:cephalosporin hydroxylase
MRLTIDSEQKQLIQEQGGDRRVVPLYSAQGFGLLSQWWLKVGWSQKYSYGFSWLGRPIIQLPEDVVRIQEVIHRVRPDLIVETGVAHGGSLIFYASLCKALDRGRVIGIDIDIRPHNRAAIEAHPLAGYITLLEGSSTDPAIVKQVREQLRPGDNVLVILDSNHTKAHVTAELHAYGDMVSKGSFIVAADGIMEDLADIPGGGPEWSWDNPGRAVREFLQERSDFVLEQSVGGGAEETGMRPVTYWPSAFLRRVA